MRTCAPGSLGAAAGAVRNRGLEQIDIVGRRHREIVRLLQNVLERARELRAIDTGKRHLVSALVARQRLQGLRMPCGDRAE